MLAICIFACGVAAGWILRAAKAEADMCRYMGPRQSITRGKTGPDPMDIPAIWR